jgi:hypothetical protein
MMYSPELELIGRSRHAACLELLRRVLICVVLHVVHWALWLESLRISAWVYTRIHACIHTWIHPHLELLIGSKLVVTHGHSTHWISTKAISTKLIAHIVVGHLIHRHLIETWSHTIASEVLWLVHRLLLLRESSGLGCSNWLCLNILIESLEGVHLILLLDVIDPRWWYQGLVKIKE